MRTVLVYRDPLFSPNSVEKDAAIISRVGELMAECGSETLNIDEKRLTQECDADVFLSMGRFPETLRVLKEKERDGALVVNAPSGVERCNRRVVDTLMRRNGVPSAPLFSGETNSCGYWLKRADVSAQSAADVVFAGDKRKLFEAMERFKARGVEDVLVTEHVKGDVVKFYGVAGTCFFRRYYPSDDGQMKFDDECRNGEAHHYTYNVEQLRTDAEKLAKITGVAVYGGDCVVREDGSYAIIDFNDWPSFSRCREEAAQAIVLKVKGKIV